MNLPGAVLVGNLWWYAFAVLRPAQMLKPLGLIPRNDIGRPPVLPALDGAGPLFSRQHREPVYLPAPPAGYQAVEEFDELSGHYDQVIEPFSRPIYEETVRHMQPLLTRRSRILDCSCGPGTEAFMLTALVPDGEVVASDLAADMVKAAFEGARQRGLDNMAFFQADVSHMPRAFADSFDAIYCSLAFHHYPQPLDALVEMRRVLRPGGAAFIADAGPLWMKLLGSPLAKWADPGWVAFRTGHEFQQLFAQAGYSDFYWTELLPGIGLSIGVK
jgi:SAM-dependent methyltransferase